MDSPLEFGQLVLEAACDDVEPEVEDVPEDGPQIQAFRAADLWLLGWHETGQVHDDIGLQRRVLVQVRHDHPFVGVLLELERDSVRPR